jgi:pimeloyl-ACP methyl ester carboxylesterase
MTATPRVLRTCPPGLASWSVTAAYDLYRALVDGVTDYACAVIERGDTPAEVATDLARWGAVAARRDRPQWTTPHRVVRETPIARVRDFTVAPRGRTVPTVVLPPQAGHDSCIVDFSSEQSQIGAMLDAGLTDLVSLDWVGATPASAGATIDDYVRVIDETVDELGGRANLVGDCQGGWLATIYTAMFPAKVHTLTLAGAPVDFHAGEPIISDFVSVLGRPGDLSFYENVVAAGSGVLPGEFMLNGFKAMQPAGEVDRLLQLLVNVRDERHLERYAAFERWFQHTQDIPGGFYLWIVEHLFQRNELVRGELEVCGRRADSPHRLPALSPGRIHRPHHSARPGLRPGRLRQHAARGRHVGRRTRWAPRALHGPHEPERALAADPARRGAAVEASPLDRLTAPRLDAYAPVVPFAADGVGVADAW